MKERITKNGIDYVLVGDYYIPDLKLPEEERPIGKYGRMHREYLRENHPILFNVLVLSCQLWTYLADINDQAQERLQVIISQMQKAESVTEKMKEDNGGKQMKDVWTGALTKPSEKTEGKHPTQKPEYLLERIVLASTEEGQIILDPFCGSGTTGVEAIRLGRKFIGIEVREEYLQISKKRLEKVANDK